MANNRGCYLMIYNSENNTLIFRAYRVPVFCWRCWKWFSFFSPNEFEDLVIYRCDRCAETRASQIYGEGEGYARKKYLDLHYPTLVGWGGKREERAFLSVFEDKWTEACQCGGHFRLRVPVRCPRCHAPEIRLLRGRLQLIDSPAIPALKFHIPDEYANAPSRLPKYPGELKVIHRQGSPPNHPESPDD